MLLGIQYIIATCVLLFIHFKKKIQQHVTVYTQQQYNMVYSICDEKLKKKYHKLEINAMLLIKSIKIPVTNINKRLT